MSGLLTAIPTGLTAFAATNLDDIVILSVFCSQVNAIFRHRHIIAGQYFGFGALVIASLPSFFGSLLIPQPWIGLLGMVPIAMGISRWVKEDTDDGKEAEEQSSMNSWFTSFMSPQTYSVAAVTIANGSDNIAIYAPLFASCTWSSLLVILTVFFTLVGVWCYTAYRLARTSAIADALNRYGNQFVPFVMIGLGVMILVNSHTLEYTNLAVITLVISCFGLLTLGKNIWRTSQEVRPQVENN